VNEADVTEEAVAGPAAPSRPRTRVLAKPTLSAERPRRLAETGSRAERKRRLPALVASGEDDATFHPLSGVDLSFELMCISPDFEFRRLVTGPVTRLK